MKKFVSILLVMLFLSSTAFATKLPIVRIPSSGVEITPQSVRTEPDYEYQTCYLPVTTVHLDSNGAEYSRVTNYIAAYTIKYKIVYNLSTTTNRVLGGSVSKGSELVFTACDSWIYDLNIVTSRSADPSTSVSDLVDTYQIYISGGAYYVTYNSTFYIDVSGTLVSTVRETVERSYYYVKTYNQPFS